MKAKLISLDAGALELKIVLDKLPAIVGRGPDADIYLDDRWTSRIHCEISELNGTLLVRDLESRHGTFVNGECVAEAHLRPGDRLTVGLTGFEVRYRRGRSKTSADDGHGSGEAPLSVAALL